MPQKSIGFAIASVRVREGTLLRAEQIERLQNAPSVQSGLHMLQEWGYGEGETAENEHSYEAWISKRMDDTRAYVRGITPDERLINALLLPIDAHNLKALCKARIVNRDAEPFLLSGGMLSREQLAQALEGSRLPARHLREALEKLRALGERAPLQTVDVTIDAACARQSIEWARESKCAELVDYLRGWVDKANLLAAFRLQKMGRDNAALAAVWLPEGEVPLETVRNAWEEPEKLHALPRIGALLAKGIAQYRKTGSLSDIERRLDDELLQRVRRKGYSTRDILPLVGYYLARERECALIRLSMIGLINALPAQTVRERMRQVYG